MLSTQARLPREVLPRVPRERVVGSQGACREGSGFPVSAAALGWGAVEGPGLLGSDGQSQGDTARFLLCCPGSLMRPPPLCAGPGVAQQGGVTGGWSEMVAVRATEQDPGPCSSARHLPCPQSCPHHREFIGSVKHMLSGHTNVSLPACCRHTLGLSQTSALPSHHQTPDRCWQQ